MGRPKKEPTKILNFRVPESDKKELVMRYPELAKMFKAWYKNLLK